MVSYGGRGRSSQFYRHGRRPLNDSNNRTNNYSILSVVDINDLHLDKVVDIVFEVSSPTSTPPISQSTTSTSVSVAQQNQSAQQSRGQRKRTKRPGWTVEEEIKLVNYVRLNYELLSNNKKSFWRKFGKNSGQILHYPRSADSCKTKFYALIARYRRCVDLYDAIERYLDLEEGLVTTGHAPSLQRVSPNVEEEGQESLSTISSNSTTREETTSCSIQQSNFLQKTNDFPSFVANIQHQIFTAQDYLNKKKSRAEDHLNSLNAVHHLFTQLEKQFQKMSMEEL